MVIPPVMSSYENYKKETKLAPYWFIQVVIPLGLALLYSFCFLTYGISLILLMLWPMFLSFFHFLLKLFFAFCKLYDLHMTFYIAYNHFVVQRFFYNSCFGNRNYLFTYLRCT